MNTFWLSHVNEGIFVHPATRSGWWNSENGYVRKSSRLFHIVISFSASQKSSGNISSMIANFLLK